MLFSKGSGAKLVPKFDDSTSLVAEILQLCMLEMARSVGSISMADPIIAGLKFDDMCIPKSRDAD